MQHKLSRLRFQFTAYEQLVLEEALTRAQKHDMVRERDRRSIRDG